MTESELKNLICNILRQIAPESDPEALAPDTNIREALDIDSYDLLQFLVRIGEETGVELPEADYVHLLTLGELLRYLGARLCSPAR